MENQQSRLRQAMKTLDMKRIAFATALDCSPRMLDAYLLPGESKGFRKAMPAVEQRLMALLRERDLAQQHLVLQATLDSSVPPVVCADFGFVFPTVYRLEGDSHIQGYPRVGISKDDRHYTLTADTTRHSEVRNPRITPLARRTEQTDEDWLIINEHRSYDRANAYIYAVLQTLAESLLGSIDLYQFDGRIFSLLHRAAPERARYDCVTLYRSDAYEKTIKPVINTAATRQEQSIWQLALGPDGLPLIDADDLFIEDEIDLSGITLVQESKK